MSVREKRICAEAKSLPSWVELLEQKPADHNAITWQLQIKLPIDISPLSSCSLTFPEAYPFKPPDLQIEGTTISLPYNSGQWSPAMKAENVLEQFHEKIVDSARARLCAEKEIEQLRMQPPSWLVNIGSLKLPRWISDEDTVIATGRHLNLNRMLRTREDWEKIGSARRPAPSLGPWRVTLILRAPANSKFDHAEISRGIRVELTIGSGFPAQPPRLNVCTIIQHLLGAFVMPDMFYESLRELHGENCGINAVLEHFRMYLAEPLTKLSSMGLPNAPSVKGPMVIDRWHASADGNYERLLSIACYAPHRLNQDFYDVGPGPQGVDAWVAMGLNPELAEAIKNQSLLSFAKQVVPGVFCFDMFSVEACDRLLGEIENYEKVAAREGWLIARPNSMNNHGVIINNIGLEPWVDALQADILSAIAAEMYPLEGSELTRHHSFLVAYEPGGDLGLDMHTDDSDVTFNICLGKDFSGGSLTFCGRLGQGDHRQMQCAYSHKKGACVVHLGRHRHGADDVGSGARRNLIIWNTNQCYRSTREYQGLRPPYFIDYLPEGVPPDVVCVSQTHDRDAAEALHDEARRPSKESRSGTPSGYAWCPPAGAEYTQAKRRIAPGNLLPKR